MADAALDDEGICPYIHVMPEIADAAVPEAVCN
jgi:hypothetical protein